MITKHILLVMAAYLLVTCCRAENSFEFELAPSKSICFSESAPKGTKFQGFIRQLAGQIRSEFQITANGQYSIITSRNQPEYNFNFVNIQDGELTICFENHDFYLNPYMFSLKFGYELEEVSKENVESYINDAENLLRKIKKETEMLVRTSELSIESKDYIPLLVDLGVVVLVGISVIALGQWIYIRQVLKSKKDK